LFLRLADFLRQFTLLLRLFSLFCVSLHSFCASSLFFCVSLCNLNQKKSKANALLNVFIIQLY
ncbi:hypothetical protein AB1L05_26400, partial [Cytobacillus horneckiae]|uniref:hypothetical protein n=1 Tax=Cytobacillus horneckiae TaxID=549687 RepID=UPI0039A3E145